VKEAQERLMKDIMESRRREKGHKEAAKTAEKEREAKEQDTEPDYGAEFLQVRPVVEVKRASGCWRGA
jgi:hypothetical protein